MAFSKVPSAPIRAAASATGLEGRPRAVILEGPAGTGKSRLARDAIERALAIGLANALVTTWSVAQSPDEGLRGLVENALRAAGVVVADVDYATHAAAGRAGLEVAAPSDALGRADTALAELTSGEAAFERVGQTWAAKG